MARKFHQEVTGSKPTNTLIGKLSEKVFAGGVCLQSKRFLLVLFSRSEVFTFGDTSKS